VQQHTAGSMKRMIQTQSHGAANKTRDDKIFLKIFLHCGKKTDIKKLDMYSFLDTETHSPKLIRPLRESAS
jgi:hypothetical protein